jgi:uncharacterized phiE125 gp8 family phage protein
MSERLIAPPAALALSLDAARRAARASGTALDAELTDKVQGIAEDAEHATGRAFITQTWELAMAAFPEAIRLPHPPVASVVHVKYYDAAGIQQTLSPQDYLVDAKSEPGWILPAPGKTWPPTAARANAVEVQYVCGYGPDSTSVPGAIREYIAGMLENHYYPNPNAEYLCRKLDRYWVPG